MTHARDAERAELHKTIWRIANNLRGSVDGWDFKSYILGLMFYRFIPSHLFVNMRERARHDDNLNETLAKVFKEIEGSAVGTESEGDLKGLFDDLDVIVTDLEEAEA